MYQLSVSNPCTVRNYLPTRKLALYLVQPGRKNLVSSPVGRNGILHVAGTVHRESMSAPSQLTANRTEFHT